MFTQHPRIRILVCGNDMMALGAIRYLQETKNKSVKVIGYDALEEARQAIREGWLAASVDQQAAQQRFMGVSSAARMLKGERLPARSMLYSVARPPHATSTELKRRATGRRAR